MHCNTNTEKQELAREIVAYYTATARLTAVTTRVGLRVYVT